MKQRVWLKYSLNENIVEITMRSPSGGKLDVFKFRVNDYPTKNKVLSILQQKYNLNLSKQKQEVDKDIEWLKRDVGY